MQNRPKLLPSMIDALRKLGYVSLAPKLAKSFDLVAARRPELLSRALFAERGCNTVQLEGVFRVVLKELSAMAAEADHDEICAPDLSNLRFNHSTGRLHVGHGSRWVYVFPRPATKDPAR